MLNPGFNVCLIYVVGVQFPRVSFYILTGSEFGSFGCADGRAVAPSGCSGVLSVGLLCSGLPSVRSACPSVIRSGVGHLLRGGVGRDVGTLSDSCICLFVSVGLLCGGLWFGRGHPGERGNIRSGVGGKYPLHQIFP